MAKVGLLNFPYFATLSFTYINIKRHWLYGEVKFDEVDKIKRKNSKGRHGDGKRQQGERQHDDGGGQHDDGDGRHSSKINESGL